MIVNGANGRAMFIGYKEIPAGVGKNGAYDAYETFNYILYGESKVRRYVLKDETKHLAPYLKGLRWGDAIIVEGILDNDFLNVSGVSKPVKNGGGD